MTNSTPNSANRAAAPGWCVVVASGNHGISDTVLMGSTAQRVQSYAECPVLVVREPRHRRG